MSLGGQAQGSSPGDGGDPGHSGSDAGDHTSDSGADAAATCSCVAETITWFYTGGLGPGQMNRITPSCEFSYASTLAWVEPTCSNQASACATAEVQSALALPGVQSALEQAPAFYGANASFVDVDYLRIDIGGRIIDIGEICSISQDCLIPDDINTLRLALENLSNGQLVQSPCRDKFTNNGLSCEQRKTNEGYVLGNLHSGGECVTAADCEFVSLDTACVARCGLLVSHPFAAWVELQRARADARLCDDYASECTPSPPPPCLPRTAACVDGECVEQ